MSDDMKKVWEPKVNPRSMVRRLDDAKVAEFCALGQAVVEGGW
jgi:hypothetical protein